MSGVITILSFLLSFILYLITMDVIFGHRAKKGAMKKYYAFIQGRKTVKKSFFAKYLRLNTDEKQYDFNTRKYLLYALPVCIGIFLFMLFFFRSLTFSILISIFGLLYPRLIVINQIKKRKMLLNNQLKEAMFTLSSSLRAGASLQKAIERGVFDLERIFHQDKHAPIVLEFRRMSQDISMGYSIEETLLSFKNRVKLEDVDDMVSATLIAKTRGGNMTEIFGNIANIISDKIEIKKEIDVMTAGKKMESNILSVMPIGIVFCLTILSPQYMSPMYDSVFGKALLFVGFGLIAINYMISRKIIDIEV